MSEAIFCPKCGEPMIDCGFLEKYWYCNECDLEMSDLDLIAYHEEVYHEELAAAEGEGMPPQIKPIKQTSKSKAYLEYKSALCQCWDKAKEEGATFDEIVALIKYIFDHDRNTTGAIIGNTLNLIFNTAKGSSREWFFESWFGINRKSKNAFDILREVAAKSPEKAKDMEEVASNLAGYYNRSISSLVLSYYKDVSVIPS